MSLILVITTLSALVCISNAANNDNPVVHTSLGSIRGSLMSTRLNKTIFAFRGVRYGKSTEGQRRFKQAEPVESWTNVFDASEEGPSCPLSAVPRLTSEDCLRLNVYTTKLPDSKNKVKRPVIVFLHPGGFYGYSGQSYVFGPQYLLDKDVVLVTINYRLHTLGFISTGDARAPSNLGLKDQVVALRWLQKHIASFGGDPNSVTLTGYSSGAWSISLHLLSPMSKNLFHRVVVMSGAAGVGQMLLPTEQKGLIDKHARLVGCPTTGSLDDSIECLKNVPHQVLSNATLKFAEWYDDPLLIWSPVVEPEVPGVERFISDQPAKLIKQKKIYQVPVIAGITKDEWVGITPRALEQAMKGDHTIFRNFTDNWEYAAPICFGYERNTEHSRYISGELNKFYFNSEPITLKNGRNLGVLYAEGISFSTQRFAKLMAKYSRAPVYNYQFVYQGRYSFNIWNVTNKPYGVMHHDDLQYLFFMWFMFPMIKENDPEARMIDKMTEMWYSFAKTGEPVPKNNQLFKGVTWKTLTPDEQNYLEIGDEWRLKTNMIPERYALYDRLFPI
ncbi:esterase E4-like [Copidosoma floridanum]|uniref:esterase E4-like n=1 Tax=Copidosoma floridanum TaxID=29053 RepID=UPI0006C9CE30|nr:esterase E4-like [Copidosoma floridanum]